MGLMEMRPLSLGLVDSYTLDFDTLQSSNRAGDKWDVVLFLRPGVCVATRVSNN